MTVFFFHSLGLSKSQTSNKCRLGQYELINNEKLCILNCNSDLEKQTESFKAQLKTELRSLFSPVDQNPNKRVLEEPKMCYWCLFFQHNPPWPCWRVFSFIYLYFLESKCQFVYISEDVNSQKPDSILMLQFYNTCCVYRF